MNDLEYICHTCNGHGKIEVYSNQLPEEEQGNYQPCSRCEGSGFTLTVGGRMLVEFLERHGFMRIQRADN